ncbi:MAG: AMP-binding protein, partial [Acidimicrobiales bacterium]
MAVIPSIIAGHAARFPEHAAIVVADGGDLSYGELASSVTCLSQMLVENGLDRGDTVGIALGDGIDLALSFLAVANVCAAAPLNPTYRVREFQFEIEDLSLAAMIVGEGDAEVPAAVQAARECNVPVVRVVRSGAEPGAIAFESAALPGDAQAPKAHTPDAIPPRLPADDDVALVLHTSGTTARPKIVPLTHANIAASASAIGRTLGLTSHDRGCCVMPLFHIHGLMAGLCASLVAGASVIATPGFAAPSMARWLVSHSASWYTAVPTMHQALLERRRVAGDEFEMVDLRFIRSSSASLAPTVMEELESAFGCAVVESYGMTEAAHQVSSNPLPPDPRKPGSVGVPAGPQVEVMGTSGELLGPDSVGEVVVKGPNVMTSYRGDQGATREAFEAGWFRTGDQGRVDHEGYLFLT